MVHASVLAMMNESKTDLKDELKKGLDLLQTIRDEVRVRLHLAGMEAKTEWDKLEPHLFDVERMAHDASDASRQAVSDAVARLKKLRSSL